MSNQITATFAARVIEHAGQRWITAEDAGRCLGHDPSNARRGAIKIYERHGDEFSPADTCVVNLTTQGQARTLRIFSASGCTLLSMFASTPRAKEFRAWAKRELALTPSPLPAAEGAGVREAREALLTLPLERLAKLRRIKRYVEGGLARGEINMLMGWHPSKPSDTLRKYRRQAESLGLIAPPPELAAQRERAQRLLPITLR